MGETIYDARLSLAGLTQLLHRAYWRWVYAERLEDTVLMARADWLDGAIPPERWEHGCAFSPEMEVCWWRGAADYEVRTITAETPPAGVDWHPRDMTDWDDPPDPPTAWLLVGEHDADRESDVPTWSAARIPRYLAYPVSGDPPPTRVALVAQLYRQAGQSVLYRLVCVEGVQDDGDD